MGLDMFLEGIFEQDGENVREQVIYWRKSNQVHNWFVVNAQDGEDNCQPHSVSREQLEELRDLCRAVLADNDKAEELLPTRPGFFFGAIDYDEWYYYDLTGSPILHLEWICITSRTVSDVVSTVRKA